MSLTRKEGGRVRRVGHAKMAKAIREKKNDRGAESTLRRSAPTPMNKCGSQLPGGRVKGQKHWRCSFLHNQAGTLFHMGGRDCVLCLDAVYDRCSKLPTKTNLNGRGLFITQNRRNVDLVLKNGVFVQLGHGIIHRDAVCFFAEVSFRVRYDAP